MLKVLRIFCTSMVFAAMMIAPGHGAMASVTSVPMMQMADGSPCPVEKCASMPDCPLVLRGGVGLFAIPTPGVSSVLIVQISSDVFSMTDIASTAPVQSERLRRPPKT